MTSFFENIRKPSLYRNDICIIKRCKEISLNTFDTMQWHLFFWKPALYRNNICIIKHCKELLKQFDMAASRKKVVLTIKEKYLALKEIEEKGITKTSIAEKYGVPPSTLTYWVKNKEDIISSYQANMELRDKN